MVLTCIESIYFVKAVIKVRLDNIIEVNAKEVNDSVIQRCLDSTMIKFSAAGALRQEVPSALPAFVRTSELPSSAASERATVTSWGGSGSEGGAALTF